MVDRDAHRKINKYDMSNAFSISYFKQTLKNTSNTNRYRIYINNKYFQELNNHSIYAKEVSIPGQSLNVTPIIIQGSTRNIPMTMDFDPVSITFVCDAKLKPRRAVQQWMDEMIFDKENLTIAFLDDFKCNIYIEPLTRKNEKIFKIELQDAWPKEMSEVQMGYDNENQVFEFTTSFEYYYWKINED